MDDRRQEEARKRILSENAVHRCFSELGEFDPEVYSQDPFLEDTDPEMPDLGFFP